MIYTVTLNPAIDKILFLPEFQRSGTNRLNRSMETIGGKGTHVSINLKLLGVENTALGIALGENGAKIIRLLESWGVNEKFLHLNTPGMESRTNYEIVEEHGHVCSILTERGPVLPKQMTDDLIQQIDDLLQPGDILVLTGDASNVEDTVIYARLTQHAREKGGKVALDASGKYLKEGLSSQPYLIKPNYEELCFLAGRELLGETEIIGALHTLDGYGIPMIAMTWHGNGAIIRYNQVTYKLHPIKVQAINEIGCGDAFLAALLAGIEKRMSIEETLALAAGVAAAAAESEITAGFDLERALELQKQAVVERIN